MATTEVISKKYAEEEIKIAHYKKNQTKQGSTRRTEEITI
jgi:hypothetical protein